MSSAPEYRRLLERLRELATEAEGTLYAIPVGRLAEGLPEGLSHGEQVQRTMPAADRPAGQPRVEVRPIRLRSRSHPPAGDKQVRKIEIELRVVRALPLDAIKDDDARYDEHGLAAEDGELLARVLEWTPNLTHTAAGEATGCRSLVHQSSDGAVRGGPKGAGAPQIIETIHRFRGWMLVDLAAPSAPANTLAPAINVDGGGDAAVGSTLVGTPGVWTDAVGITYQWLRDGAPIAGATSLRYTVAAEDGGASLSLRETAFGAGGSASATSNAIAVPSSGYDPSQEPGLALDLWADTAIEEVSGGIGRWRELHRGVDFVTEGPSRRPLLLADWRNGKRAAHCAVSGHSVLTGTSFAGIVPAETDVMLYVFGQLDSLAGTFPESTLLSAESTIWVMLQSSAAPNGPGWYSSSGYRSVATQASLGAHCWTFKLQHGVGGEVFEDGVSLGAAAPFNNDGGLGGVVRAGGFWNGAGYGVDGKLARILVFSQLHDTETQTRVEQWGRDYYALP